MPGITEGFPGVYDGSDLFPRVVPVGGPGRVCACFTTLERLRSGRGADPSAAIIDSQSVPTVETGSDGCSDDAGKTIKGRKRHLAVDGTALVAQVYPAHIQDRDGARPLFLALQAGQNTVQIVFADGAYGGDKLASALKEANCPITVKVIENPGTPRGASSCPGAGWSNVLSDGSAAVGAFPKTSSDLSPHSRTSCKIPAPRVR